MADANAMNLCAKDNLIVRSAEADEVRYNRDQALLAGLLQDHLPELECSLTAQRLLSRFGSLGRVCAQSRGRLTVECALPKQAAGAIAKARRFSMALLRSDISGKPVLSDQAALKRYSRSLVGGDSREQFWGIFLDKSLRLIDAEMIQRGTVDHVCVYPRELLIRALAHAASGIVLVHNHPSGNAAPSKGDLAMTARLCAGARLFGVTIVDHIVVGAGTATSLRASRDWTRVANCSIGQ